MITYTSISIQDDLYIHITLLGFHEYMGKFEYSFHIHVYEHCKVYAVSKVPVELKFWTKQHIQCASKYCQPSLSVWVGINRGHSCFYLFPKKWIKHRELPLACRRGCT